MEGNGSTPELGKTQILLLARKKRFVWNRAEPLGQESYENAVDEFIERAGKEEAIELALSIEEASRQGAAMGPFSLYPILLAFERRFGGTPELYVEIYYNLVASGGTRLELGPEYLKKGYEMDPHNRHVLWCMFMAYPAIHGVPRPSYTRDLLLGSSSTEHERECLSRILAISPDDELARVVLKWIEDNNTSCRGSSDIPIPISELDERTRPTCETTLREILEQSRA